MERAIGRLYPQVGAKHDERIGDRVEDRLGVFPFVDRLIEARRKAVTLVNVSTVPLIGRPLLMHGAIRRTNDFSSSWKSWRDGTPAAMTCTHHFSRFGKWLSTGIAPAGRPTSLGARRSTSAAARLKDAMRKSWRTTTIGTSIVSSSSMRSLVPESSAAALSYARRNSVHPPFGTTDMIVIAPPSGLSTDSGCAPAPCRPPPQWPDATPAAQPGRAGC